MYSTLFSKNRCARSILGVAAETFGFQALESRRCFAGPVLGPELVLLGDTTPALSVGTQTNPTLAEGPGGVSLAVWQDTRSGANPNVPFGVGLGTQTDIYASRVRADGSVIDVTPIPVSIASYNQSGAKAAWNGTNWLVAWTSPRDNDMYETDINAVRISPDGVVLDAAPMVIGTHLTNPSGSNDFDPLGPLQVASDGTDWFITYRRHNPNLAGGLGMEWFATKVLAAGSVPNAEGVKLLAGDQYDTQYGFTYAPVNGGQFLHTFAHAGSIYSKRYDRNLLAVGGSPAATSDEFTGRVSVAGGPQGWLIASQYDFADWENVQVQRVLPSGAFADAAAIDISESEYGLDMTVDVVWNGVDWTVAYSGSRDQAVGGHDIFVRRIDPAATGDAIFRTAWINATPIEGTQHTPELVTDGIGGVKVAYVSELSNTPGISLALISPENVVSESSDVSLAAPSQGGSRLASDGNNFLMVFGSSSAYGTRLLAQRVTPHGAALDAEPITIADVAEKVVAYEVAYFNGRYVVFYQAQQGPSGHQIYARTLGTDGTVGTAQGILGVTNYTGFGLGDASVNGDRLLLVGNSPEGQLNRSYRFGQVFDSSFAPVSSRFQLETSYATGGDSEAVSGGWISAWATRSVQSSNRPYSAVYAKIALDGTIVHTGVAGSTWQTKTNGVPTVVSNGSEAATEAIIAFIQTRDFLNPIIVNSDGLVAQRLDADGTLIGENFVIVDEPGIQTQPAGAFDGTDYVFTWTDQRNYPFPQQNRDDIFAARVALDGTVIDPGGFPVADDFRPETHGDVGVAGGQVLFAYNTFKHEAPWGSYRLAARGMSAPAGTLVASSEQGFEFERRHSVGFTFNKPLLGADTGDLLLTNLGTGQVISTGNFNIETVPANTQGWTYRWVYAGGALPDGNYQATLPAGSVTDMAGRPTTQAYSTSFHVLSGDVNRDRTVNFDDLLVLAQNYGQTGRSFSQGNVDYSADGVVGFEDLLILAQRYGQTMLGATPTSIKGAAWGTARKRTIEMIS